MINVQDIRKGMVYKEGGDLEKVLKLTINKVATLSEIRENQIELAKK